MNRAVSLGILALGIVLLAFGLSASDSFSADVSRAFSGSPDNKTIWLLAGGVVATVIGLIGAFRGSRAS